MAAASRLKKNFQLSCCYINTASAAGGQSGGKAGAGRDEPGRGRDGRAVGRAGRGVWSMGGDGRTRDFDVVGATDTALDVNGEAVVSEPPNNVGIAKGTTALTRKSR